MDTKMHAALAQESAVVGSYGLGLILSLSLSLGLSLSLLACATVKSLSTTEFVRETPKASVVETAVKPAQEPIDSGKKDKKKSPRDAEKNNTGNPDDETLLPQDRVNTIYFPLGSYSLDREAEAVIKRHAEKLMADQRLLVTLIGHTDDLGSKEYNDALCIKRASAVKQALVDVGVAPRQIRLSNRYGYETAPPKPCLTDACRKLLRRVEFR